MAQKNSPLPRVDFISEAQNCVICKSHLKTQKSTTRIMSTLETGTFQCREVIKECTKDSSHPTVHSEALAKIIKPRHSCGYDIMVDVGLLRYLYGKQREEIRTELYHKIGRILSDGNITNLCDRFLNYLETLHEIKSPYLREHIQKYGYQLHIDATCENGRGGVLVCMEGNNGWVLMAGKIPSENEQYMLPIVEKAVRLFGEPISTMRDLGCGMEKTTKSLKARGVRDLICHYHFLQAVGEKLFENHYDTLRKIIRQCNVRSDLWTVLRDLKNHLVENNYSGGFGIGVLRQDLLALIYWLLEGSGKKKPLYPFTLPHLGFYDRCQLLKEQADSWVPLPRTSP
jgi:hypothetical protein